MYNSWHLPNHKFFMLIINNNQLSRRFNNNTLVNSYLLIRNLKYNPTINFLLAVRKMSTLPKTDAEWKKVLSPEEYRVIRQKGTESAGTGEYNKFKPKEGYFACKACGQPLYTYQAKFDSGCGWPAFDKCVKGSVKTHVDNSFFMKRIEITCAKCDGHLGHVFEGEGFTPTDERHCVNSVSVKYVKEPLPAGVEEEALLQKKL
jgi:peptide-methionine (R)-S-oxide reductase